MLMGSNLNIYTKKLLEAEDQFFDFPSEDESFDKDYSEYKKDSSFYDKEKYFNSQYPDFDEDDGIVYFLSECIIEFFNQLCGKEEDGLDYDDSYTEFRNNFRIDNLSREKKREVNRSITEYLTLEHINSKIIDIDNVVDDFINDMSDLDSDINVVVDYTTSELLLTDVMTDSVEYEVNLEDNDSVNVNDYTITLSEFKEYLEEDEELMNFLLDRNQNKYIQNEMSSSGVDLDSSFLEKVKKYVLSYRYTIRSYYISGEDEYYVVINKDELLSQFEKYLDENDIEYDYIKSEDNSVWEDEDLEDEEDEK